MLLDGAEDPLGGVEEVFAIGVGCVVEERERLASGAVMGLHEHAWASPSIVEGC